MQKTFADCSLDPSKDAMLQNDMEKLSWIAIRGYSRKFSPCHFGACYFILYSQNLESFLPQNFPIVHYNTAICMLIFAYVGSCDNYSWFSQL